MPARRWGGGASSTPGLRKCGAAFNGLKALFQQKRRRINLLAFILGTLVSYVACTVPCTMVGLLGATSLAVAGKILELY